MTTVRAITSAVAALLLVGCVSSPPRLSGDILYMAVGASDAVGVGATPLTDGYVYLIEDELEERGAEVRLLNLGIPGAEVDRIADAVRLVLRTGLRPDLVTVWVGANDLIDGDDVADFESKLGDMLARLREDTPATIVIANLPDLTELPRFQEDPLDSVTRERIRDFNDAIEDQAERFNIPVVDLAAEEVKTKYVSDADGFHPSEAGHRRLAELFLDVILPELASRQRAR